jgi:hypothetical protein
MENELKILLLIIISLFSLGCMKEIKIELLLEQMMDI